MHLCERAGSGGQSARDVSVFGWRLLGGGGVLNGSVIPYIGLRFCNWICSERYTLAILDKSLILERLGAFGFRCFQLCGPR